MDEREPMGKMEMYATMLCSVVFAWVVLGLLVAATTGNWWMMYAWSITIGGAGCFAAGVALFWCLVIVAREQVIPAWRQWWRGIRGAL